MIENVPARTPPRTLWLIAPALLVIQAIVLLAMDRTPICTCGTIKLWHSSIWSAENSQHILDWYSFSHVIHGFALYLLTRLALPQAPLAARLAAAVLIEGAWEVVENSQFIISRYRADTLALNYNGDSVINSVSDTLCMMVGFALAYRLPTFAIIALALVMELTVGYLIRDNLTLNVIMLIFPSDAIKAWQLGAR